MCPCVFTASTAAGGTSRGIRLDFQFFLLFRLFSRCSPSLGSAPSWGGGMGAKAVGGGTSFHGTGCGPLTREFLCLPFHSFIPCSLPAQLSMCIFPSGCHMHGADPPKPLPLEQPCPPKIPEGMAGGCPGPEARDGCRDRGCGSRLSAHAWHELRGETGKDRIQLPGEHGFGSLEKSGLLQIPSRVAGTVLVGRGRWVRPVID